MRKIGFGLAFAVAVAFALVLSGCGQALPMVKLPAINQAPPPAAPQSLAVRTADGQALDPGAWTNQSKLTLSAALGNAAVQAQLTPEVEFLPADQPFAGRPNLDGSAGQAAVAAPALINGLTYHWQMRVRAADGQVSAWAAFPGPIGYETGPTPAPAILPLPHGGWFASPQVQVRWGAAEDAAGLAGYAYSLDQDPNGTVTSTTTTGSTGASFKLTKDGDWYFHLKAIDAANNVSPVISVPLHLDSTPLKLSPPQFDDVAAFNPITGPVDITVKLGKPAQATVSLVPDKSTRPVRTFNLGQTAGAKVQWDGKDDHGQLVPPGDYHVLLSAVDKAGQTAQVVSADTVTLTDKRIVVSLSQQKLVAYEGDKVVLSSLITSGGPDLPTPTGTFHILQKSSPFTFHSPWPKGSPFWYADSPTTYAMLFEAEGYFIHDAPWRSWYGPGSNVVAGTPGGNDTGTHGCINAPFGVAQALYAWTPVGTPVIVQN